MQRFVALFFAFLCALTPLKASALQLLQAEIRVCDTCDFKSIRSAIESAPAGATIRVNPGLYKESGIVIDKPLRLRALLENEQPIVDGQGKGTVFFVRAANVEISGFEIRNSGVDFIDEFAGIKATDSSGCRFSDNTLEGNQFGIYLGRVHSCAITDNRIRGNNLSESASGNGIHVWYGEAITITGNTVSGHRDGLYFEFTKNSSIKSNRVLSNLRYGLHFMFSNNNEYRGNEFIGNESGVAVMYSKSIQMFGNRFADSRGGAAYGILLKDISDSFIVANKFTGNTVGVYLEGTSRSEFTGNTFERNGWAVKILGDCDENKFSRNDFVDNTFDVSTNATANRNAFLRNYWSRYRGLDLDKNGVGDDPYFLVQLSTLMMERFGASVLLINSFFFTLLDQVESVLPVLTPASFNDPEPEMKRLTNDG